MHCVYCGKKTAVCAGCHRCGEHCQCTAPTLFDADELGLDPETDNTPEDPDRHA